MPDGTQIPVHDKYVEIIDYAPYKDWEQIRINAAISAMQGLIINAGNLAFVDEKEIAKQSRAFADALVKELQK